MHSGTFDNRMPLKPVLVGDGGGGGWWCGGGGGSVCSLANYTAVYEVT